MPDSQEQDVLTVKHCKLTRGKMLALLDVLNATDEPAATLYLPSGVSREGLNAYLQQMHITSELAVTLGREIASAQTGVVLFWGKTQKRLVVPPFPERDKCLVGGYDTASLRTMLARDSRIGVILVRLGSFSIGVCEGERLVDHRTGTGLVHGRHRQGGSSAARFQRRRGEQAHQFLLRVAGHAEEKMGPYAKTLDYLVYGGARTTTQELRKISRFLAQFDDRLLPPLLSIPDPRYEVLEKAVIDIWSSRVTEWREDVPEFT